MADPLVPEQPIMKSPEQSKVTTPSSERPKQPLGEVEQKVANRIAQDGDPDRVLQDIGGDTTSEKDRLEQAKPESGQDLALQISNEQFLKEGKPVTLGAHRIAYSPDGSKYFIKTSPYLTTPRDQLPDWIDLNQMRDSAERSFQSEEFAWRMADNLGVPMAETRFVQVEGLPWAAARFIEGAEDKAFGGNIVTGSDKIKAELGKISAFKFIIHTGGDNGQYLQAPEDEVYIMDVQVPFSGKNYTKRGEEELLEEVLSGRVEPFGSVTNVVQSQLVAINNGWVDSVFDKAESLDEATVTELTKNFKDVGEEERLNAAREIIDGAKSSRKILHFLAENRDLTMKAINPYFGGERRKLVPETDQAAAKGELIKRFKEALNPTLKVS